LSYFQNFAKYIRQKWRGNESKRRGFVIKFMVICVTWFTFILICAMKKVQLFIHNINESGLVNEQALRFNSLDAA